MSTLPPHPTPSRLILSSLFHYNPLTGLFHFQPSHSHSSRSPSIPIPTSLRPAFTSLDAFRYHYDRIGGRKYRAHHIIAKLIHDDDTLTPIYLNGNRSDNRLCNFLFKPPFSPPHAKGVCSLHPAKGYRAYITNNNKTTNLGHFSTHAQALRARHAAERDFQSLRSLQALRSTPKP